MDNLNRYFTLFLLFFLATVSSAQNPPATVAPFSCTPAFYHTHGTNGPGAISVHNNATFSTAFTDIANLGYNINGTGYNPVDNFLYAIRASDKFLLRIHSDGSVDDLGDLGLAAIYTNNVVIGGFDSFGTYYVKAGDVNTIAVIDVNALTVTQVNPAVNFFGKDWAFHANTGQFYGVHGADLYSFDPVSNIVNVVPLTGLMAGEGVVYGSTFAAADDYIYIVNNVTGNIYKIDVTDNSAHFMVQGPPGLSAIDGDSCPNAMPPFPTVCAMDDETCLDNAGQAIYDITQNDQTHLTTLNLASFSILTPPSFGTTSYNSSTGELTYTASGTPQMDVLTYEICSPPVLDGQIVCDYATVEFIPAPPITFMPFGPYCENGTADPLPGTSQELIAGTWNPNFIDTSIPGNTTYTFIPGPQYNCALPVDVVVNVVPTTDPTFSLMDTYCAGDATETLPTTSDNGVIGTWSPSVIDNQSSASYTFTPDGSGCGDDFVLNVTINSASPIDFNITDTYCFGETTDILPTTSDNGIDGTWSPSVIDNQNSNSYTFTPNAGQCATDFTLNVTINPSATPIFNLTDIYCQGETTDNLPNTSDNGIDGTWSPSVIDNQNSNSYIFTLNAGQCATDFTLNVTINPAATPIFNLTDIYCQGETTDNLPTTSDNGITGTWSPSVIDNQNSNSYTFTSNAGQCAMDFTLNVTINPAADPIFSVNDTYCEGETTDALPTISDDGITGTWSPNVIDNTQNATYTFTPDAGQCANNFFLIVSINPSTSPTFSINIAYCEGETTDNLPTTSDNGITGTWLPSVIDNQNSDTYTFTPNAGQCASDFTLNVTINPATNPVFSITDTYCAGETTDNLPANSDNGILGTWFPATIDNQTSGSYSFIPDNGQCANSFVLNVTINPATAPIFNIEDEYCADDAVDNLPNISDNGITGNWTPNSIDNQNSGTYTFSPDAEQCASDFTLNVIITPNGFPLFTLIETYCVDDVPENLPAVSDNGILGNWFPATISTTSAGSTTYTFIPDAGTCNESFAFTVTVNDCGCQNPATVSIDPIAPICENETLNLNAILGGSATNVTWTTSGDGTFDNENIENPVYSPSTADVNNGTVTLQVTTNDPDGNGPCTPVSADVVVNINVLVNSTFNLTNTYCEGETTDLLPTTSDNGITGNWMPAMIDNSANGTYTFVPDAGQCANDFTLNVTINPIQTPTFTLTDTYCVNDAPENLPATSDNGITGTWSPVTISTASANTTTYIFTPDGTTCADNFSIEITVNDCGCQNPAMVSIDPISAICENETVNLNATLGGSATQIIWTTDGDGTFDNANIETPIYTSGANDIVNGMVNLTATTDDPDGNGPCTAATSTVVLNINALVNPTFDLTDTYCEGETTDNLPATSDNGITGNWMPAMIDNSANGIYTFLPDAGQCADDFILNVTITPNQTPTFTLTDTYCVNDAPENLSATSENGVAGTWSPATINTASANGTTYIFTPDGTACADNFSIEITVNDCGCQNPAMVSIDPIGAICENETINLNGTLGGSATQITWSTDGDGTFDDANIETPIYTPGTNDIANGMVNLTATTDDPDGNGLCTAATSTVVLNINSLTNPTFDITDTYCEGETTDNLPATSDNGITGTWMPAMIDNSANGIYTFTPDAGQCVNDFTLNVTITPNQIPTFTLTDTYCVNDTPENLLTTSDNGVTGTWSPTAINTASANVTTYIFTPDGTTCADNFSIEITVNDCGCQNPAIVSIDPISAICENETLNLNAALGGSATQIIWTTDGDGTFDDANIETPIYTPGANDIANGMVNLTATTDDPDGNGPCTAATALVSLNINSLPTATVQMTDCDNNAQTYSAIIEVSNANNVISGTGTVIDNGNGTFTISDLPVNMDITVELENSTTGCGAFFDIAAPDCDCPTVADPTGAMNNVFCFGEMPTILSVDDPGAGFEVNWFNVPMGGISLATGNTFTPSTAGIFYAEITDLNTNCVSNRIAVELTENPALFLNSNTEICPADTSNYELEIDVSGGTAPYTLVAGNLTITQNTANNFTISNVNGTGGVEVTLSDAAGCESIFTIQAMVADEVLANITTNPQINTLDCEITSINLSATGSTSGANSIYEWEFEGTITQAENIDATAPGIYVLTVTNSQTGCTATDNIIIEMNEGFPPVIFAQPEQLNCQNTEVIIDATDSDLGPGFMIEYQWSEVIGNDTLLINGETNLTLETTSAGIFCLTAIDSENGCTNTDCIEIFDNSVLPNVEAGDNQNIDCETTEIQLMGSTDVSNPQIEWTSQNPILAGANTLTPTVQNAGIYYLTITNLNNGCVGTDSVNVFANDIPMATISFVQPDCNGNNGSIEIDTVMGGMTPYIYSVNNGSSFSDETVFESLPAGNYTVIVQDANGCESSESITLNLPNPIEIALETEQNIILGESYQLNAQVFSDAPIDFILWSTTDSLSCTNCLNPVANPTATSIYNLLVTNELGCTAEASITLLVNTQTNIFAPNIFSPNNDGSNDFFTIYSNEGVELIEELRIFDRWGEAVFTNTDFLPNQPQMGWDGTWNGEKLDAGVFLFFAKIKMVDGREEMLKGDVTLMK